MVEELDPDKLANLLDTLGDGYVFSGRLGAAARMIVYKHDRNSSSAKCWPEHFTGVNQRCVRCALGDTPPPKETVAAVKKKHVHLLHAASRERPARSIDVFWTADRQAPG